MKKEPNFPDRNSGGGSRLTQIQSHPRRDGETVAEGLQPGGEAALTETLPAQMMRDGTAEGQRALPPSQNTLGIISLWRKRFVTISTVCLSQLGALPYILD